MDLPKVLRCPQNDGNWSAGLNRKTISAKNRRLLFLGLAVGGIAAALVFINTDLGAVWQILRDDLDYALAITALLVYSLYFYGKALRWHYLLAPIVAIPPLQLLPYVLTGYAGNVLLPFQAGEAGRGYLLSKHYGIKTAASLSGIALEKFFDFFALLVLLLWSLATLDVVSPLAVQVAVSLIIALMLVGFVLVGLLINPPATIALIELILYLCPKVISSRLEPLFHDAIAGLAALREAGLLAKLVASSFVTWVLMLVALQLSLAAIDLEVPLAVAIVVMTLAAVGLALPTSPGFVGTLQAAFVLGMVPFGVEQEAAVAASLLYQFLTTVPPLAVGAICFLRLSGRSSADPL